MAFAETVRKLMGWCPACKKTTQQTKRFYDFANTATIPGKTVNILEFQTTNVIFSANTFLFILLFVICFNLLMTHVEDISLFLVGLLLLNIPCYLLVLKTFEAAVLVDGSGIHLQAFRLKKLDIPYEEIERITSYRLEKRSKKMSLLLRIGEIAFCGFVVYMAVVKGEWKIPLLLVSLLPLILFAARKQKTQLENLNMQLYIKTKHKKWYEWDSYYSLITDENSAAEIKSSIERHL
ncbi:DUF1673 family protein [Methanosarcina barkeri]|uniref:DUF1673 family protein n=1 Tax=Methanosarcina barkeri CM1 TaxID=796385 RepID=A0A0G3CES2_METBA|nr:DUF1673 family protein [Methanosarcina barkeri]AKJ40519.1 hypothetical protein MCM1_3536 [Methanosarcina barkeri CM1]